MRSGILGDINPKPGLEDHVASKKDSARVHESEESMVGGSQHDRTEHSGSRGDHREGVTGGLSGTEVGGTRNLRQGHGSHRRRHRKQT